MKPHSHWHSLSGRMVISNHTHTGRFDPRPAGPAFQDHSYTTRAQTCLMTNPDRCNHESFQTKARAARWPCHVALRLINSQQFELSRQKLVLIARQQFQSLAAKVHLDRHQFDSSLRQKVMILEQKCIMIANSSVLWAPDSNAEAGPSHGSSLFGELYRIAGSPRLKRK